MRWLLALFFILMLAAAGGYIFLQGFPYKVYSRWVVDHEWNRYYRLTSFRDLYLKPSGLTAQTPYVENYAQLWKPFPIRNSLIPLPTRHPLFMTYPLIELKNKDAVPQIGIILTSPTGREVSRIYTLPTSLVQDHSQGQELFKLPFIKNRIGGKSQDEVWNAVFSHVIEAKRKPVEEMIWDLYILHLRSKILPKAAVKYGLIGKDKALIELESKDKDYVVELIMNQQNGSIYSYVLKTELRNAESQKLRNKFLQEVAFTPMSESVGRMLYTEFKHLHFNRQTDQEGMLYLFSAWSQDIGNVGMLKEMIFYLERGRGNFDHLKTLYQYALKKFGKTYTTRQIFGPLDDPEMVLQRQIEIEAIAKKEAAEKVQVEAPRSEDDLSSEEKMNLYLKKAKDNGPAAAEEMTVH